MAQPAVTARESERPRAAPFAALLACVGAATVVAVAAGRTPLLALLPVTLATALYAVARAPLRASAAALVFAVLSLDISADAGGMWRTPLAALGDLLQDNLERSAGIPGVGLNGVDVGALLLLGVAALRKRSALDREGAVLAPRVIGAFLLLHLAGLLYAELVGLAAGAPVAIWKLHQLLQVPLLAVLFLAAFRGPRDHRREARVRDEPRRLRPVRGRRLHPLRRSRRGAGPPRRGEEARAPRRRPPRDARERPPHGVGHAHDERGGGLRDRADELVEAGHAPQGAPRGAARRPVRGGRVGPRGPGPGTAEISRSA